MFNLFQGLLEKYFRNAGWHYQRSIDIAYYYDLYMETYNEFPDVLAEFFREFGGLKIWVGDESDPWNSIFDSTNSTLESTLCNSLMFDDLKWVIEDYGEFAYYVGEHHGSKYGVADVFLSKDGSLFCFNDKVYPLPKGLRSLF